MKAVTLVNIGGKSHPGLLKDLTEKSLRLGASWLNSKVNYLSGYVSALIKVEVDSSKLNDLKKLFIDTQEISVSFYDVQNGIKAESLQLKLLVDAEDRPGLVNEFLQLFHDRGVKVIDLDSHRLCAAGLGNTMFTADITLDYPAELDRSEITAELEALSDDIVVRVID